ncbi:MAG: flagellin [Candidatus Zophobacter franzmannii]|nr:flagellin [Candidatus Zophobacter franzmannii]
MQINHNIAALNAWRNLGIANAGMGSSVEKLSSGLRINRGADDPAGLLISEKLRSQISGLDQAMSNASDAVSMVQTAEGALTEMNSILNSIRSLAIHASNSGAVDSDSIGADQDAVDRAITAMQRIATTTKYAGKFLLKGDSTSNTLVANTISGVTATGVSAFAASAVTGSTLDLTVTTARAVATGTITIANMVSGTGGMIFDDGTTETTYAGASIGAMGTLSALAGKLNVIYDTGTFAVATGAATSAGTITFTADAFGTNLSYAIDSNATADTIIAETDMVASINGAAGTVSGFVVTGTTAAGSGLVGTLTSATNETGAIALARVATGDLSLQFSLSEDASSDGIVTYGMSSMQAGQIGYDATVGNTAGLNDVSATESGAYTLADNAANAVAIIDQAITDVSTERANLGSFQKFTLETTINNLGVTKENLTASESRIRDVDMAAEMMEFTKNQILVQAGTAMLAQANQLPTTVLQLLG